VRVCSRIHDSGRLQRFASSAASITSQRLLVSCWVFIAAFPVVVGNIMTTLPFTLAYSRTYTRTAVSLTAIHSDVPSSRRRNSPWQSDRRRQLSPKEAKTIC
jgi:hypothetical protein